jgi:hypothetical protein
MNQIMPIGKGLVIAIERAMKMDQHQAFMELWREKFPDIPVFLANEAQIIQREGQPILFEFTGDNITPTFVAEFQRWWETVNAE